MVSDRGGISGGKPDAVLTGKRWVGVLDFDLATNFTEFTTRNDIIYGLGIYTGETGAHFKLIWIVANAGTKNCSADGNIPCLGGEVYGFIYSVLDRGAIGVVLPGSTFGWSESFEPVHSGGKEGTNFILSNGLGVFGGHPTSTYDSAVAGVEVGDATKGPDDLGM